jgi:hypothetical protein
MPYFPNLNLIFLHIPKTAGTSIEQSLNQNGGPMHLWSLYGSTPMHALQHLTYDGVRERVGEETFSAAKKFAIVRNPWTRVVSDYHWHSRGCKTFDEFLELIDRMLSDPAWPNLKNFNTKFAAHFEPQTSFVRPDIRVLRFENLGEEWSKEWHLESKTTPLGHRNKGKKKRATNIYDTYFATPKSREIMLKHYSGDMEIFGYPKHPPAAN